MKKSKKILCVILAVIVAFAGAFAIFASGVFNKYVFSIDASEKGKVLHNVVNNVNI